MSVLPWICQDVSERLDVVPAQVRVVVIRRPRDECRFCEDVVVQAPAPVGLVEGGLPTDATVVQVPLSKPADHLPHYRQVRSSPERVSRVLDRVESE